MKPQRKWRAAALALVGVLGCGEPPKPVRIDAPAKDWIGFAAVSPDGKTFAYLRHGSVVLWLEAATRQGRSRHFQSISDHTQSRFRIFLPGRPPTRRWL